MRRVPVILVTLLAALLAVAGSAQAVVVAPSAGGASVAFGAAGSGTEYGVAMAPGTRNALATAKVPTVTSAAPCIDPFLSSDLTLHSFGLCSHGGSVIHANETFALTWDANHAYWPTTLNYVEQFLRNVADGSGTLSSPYALTSQYQDATGRAGNDSVYGGGCIDEGSAGGFTCSFGNTSGAGAGEDFPASGCPVTGASQVCLTDAQIQDELSTLAGRSALLGRLTAGHSPLLVLLTPPGAEVCLTAAGSVCSINGGSQAQFCSYHGAMTIGGTQVAYVVQPWNGVSACDEPDAPKIPQNPDAAVLQTDMGIRLVSPLSQSELAAITDPFFAGWFALDGSEINDNGCAPLGQGLDSVSVGGTSYFLQREFNNGGAIYSNPYALPCAPLVLLQPTFVVPSAVKPGDVVQFDGSTSVTSLVIPRGNYFWDYGDGTTAVGPSVEHAYKAPGLYTVKLTAVDRGANVATVAREITVLGQAGPTPSGQTPGLAARVQLLPQGLRSLLRSGVSLRITSNQPASGMATLSISRSAAHSAHLRMGSGRSVVIGRGTVASVTNGVTYLRIRIAHAMASKLAHLRHLTLSVRMLLITADRGHVAVDAAGNY